MLALRPSSSTIGNTVPLLLLLRLRVSAANQNESWLYSTYVLRFSTMMDFLTWASEMFNRLSCQRRYCSSLSCCFRSGKFGMLGRSHSINQRGLQSEVGRNTSVLSLAAMTTIVAQGQWVVPSSNWNGSMTDTETTIWLKAADVESKHSAYCPCESFGFTSTIIILSEHKLLNCSLPSRIEHTSWCSFHWHLVASTRSHRLRSPHGSTTSRRYGRSLDYRWYCKPFAI